MNVLRSLRRTHSKWMVAALFAIVLVAGTIGSAAASERPSTREAEAPHNGQQAKLLPRHGAYLGIFYGEGSEASTDAKIGRAPRVHLTYFDWNANWAKAKSTKRDLATGRIPLVNWEPASIHFDDIINGRYDRMLARRAVQARRLHRPLFLDFAAEMNGDEGWGGHDPARYVAAYRHIHDIFSEHGANNVVWVWAPNNVDSPHAPPALAYYPGASYVDWTGMDGYNWGTSKPGFRWESFAQVFGPMYRRLATLHKPMIIGESASAEAGGSKPAWIESIVPTIRQRFPLIRAFVWFDIDKERRWQIDSSPATLKAFRRLAANPFFR